MPKNIVKVRNVLEKGYVEDLVSKSLPEKLRPIWNPANTVIERIIPQNNGCYLASITTRNNNMDEDTITMGYIVVPQTETNLEIYKDIFNKRVKIMQTDESFPELNQHMFFNETDGVFLVFFPVDLKLHELPQIVDKNTVEQLIFGIPSQNMKDFVRNCSVKILGYRPEKKATFLFQWAYKNDREDLVFVGKMFNNFVLDDMEKEIGFMQSSHHKKKGYYGFSFPQAVVFLPEIRSYVETYEGSNYLHNFLGKSDCSQFMNMIGDKLAILHQSNLKPNKEYLPKNELNLIKTWLAHAKVYRPELKNKLDQAFKIIENLANDLAAPKIFPSNGAACGRNFIITDEKITITDWTNVAMAPPELDLAILKSYLNEMAMGIQNDFNGFSQYWNSVENSYCRQNGQINNRYLHFFYVSRLLLLGILYLFYPELERCSQVFLDNFQQLA